MQRQIVFIVLMGLVLYTEKPSAHGEEVNSLRASFEREIGALNTRDLDTLMSNQHEQVIVLNPASPTPSDGKAVRRHGYQSRFAAPGQVTVTPKNPQFRVIDNTGLVWGEYTITTTLQDKPPTTAAVRFTRTYVKSGGQWFLVLYHVAPLPLQVQ
jgi:ketosteroid isomerase-like protein